MFSRQLRRKRASSFYFLKFFWGYESFFVGKIKWTFFGLLVMSPLGSKACEQALVGLETGMYCAGDERSTVWAMRAHPMNIRRKTIILCLKVPTLRYQGKINLFLTFCWDSTSSSHATPQKLVIRHAIYVFYHMYIEYWNYCQSIHIASRSRREISNLRQIITRRTSIRFSVKVPLIKT